jgi:hypothetical protein
MPPIAYPNQGCYLLRSNINSGLGRTLLFKVGFSDSHSANPAAAGGLDLIANREKSF